MCLTHSEGKQTVKSEFGAEKGLLQGHARTRAAHALKSPELPEGFWQSIFFFNFYLFIYDCVGSSFLCEGFP